MFFRSTINLPKEGITMKDDTTGDAAGDAPEGVGVTKEELKTSTMSVAKGLGRFAAGAGRLIARGALTGVGIGVGVVGVIWACEKNDYYPL